MNILKKTIYLLFLSMVFNACTPASLNDGADDSIVNPMATGGEDETVDQTKKD